MISIDEIRDFFQGMILVNEPMSNHNSMKIGGSADLMLVPIDKNDAIRLFQFLNQKEKKYLVIGNGSNILVSDHGIHDIVVSLYPNLNIIEVKDELIYVEAGVLLTRFVDFCISHSKKGVEKLAGIPGTIGGALVMNAGAYSSQISDFLLSVEVIENGELQKIYRKDIEFRYRYSSLNNKIILSAEFKLPDGDIKELRSVRSKCLLKRSQTQPLNYPNLGSIFKNPPNCYAAVLIESAGLKGKQIGNAMVSEKHSNFIINLGNAKATEVIELINLIRKEVYKKFNIKLELEIKLVGFNENVIENI